MSPTRVLLVRHGESEGNVANVWTSTHLGYPLTERGHEQARAVAHLLRAHEVAALYASPIPRAQQTAEEIGAVLGLPVRTLPGVEEFGVGVHEGVHDDDVAPIAAEVFGRWMRDGDLSASFEGGESGAEVVARVDAALATVVAENPGTTSVVVSHGGALALSMPALCTNLDVTTVVSHLLENTDVVEIERTDDGWRCLTWAGTPV